MYLGRVDVLHGECGRGEIGGWHGGSASHSTEHRVGGGVVHVLGVHGAGEVSRAIGRIALHRPLVPHVGILTAKVHMFTVVQRLWSRG